MAEFPQCAPRAATPPRATWHRAPPSCPQSVQTFGRKKTAVAVSYCPGIGRRGVLGLAGENMLALLVDRSTPPRPLPTTRDQNLSHPGLATRTGGWEGAQPEQQNARIRPASERQPAWLRLKTRKTQ